LLRAEPEAAVIVVRESKTIAAASAVSMMVMVPLLIDETIRLHQSGFSGASCRTTVGGVDSLTDSQE
jgi:hypothetical protein